MPSRSAGGWFTSARLHPRTRRRWRTCCGRASPRSRYLRFFSAAVNLDAEVVRLTRPGDDHVALVAIMAGQVIGVASYERLDVGTADFAVLVDDAWQGEGIGTLLLEYMAAAARGEGIETLLGDVLTTNAPMLEVAAAVAPHSARRHGDDPAVLQIEIPTQLDESALAAVGLRDRTAEHRSLRPLLAPSIGGGDRCQPTSGPDRSRGCPSRWWTVDSPERSIPSTRGRTG